MKSVIQVCLLAIAGLSGASDLLELCPKWVGNGFCDKDSHLGACYPEEAASRPPNGVEPLCLMKEQYDTVQCPSSAPLKCKFVEAAVDIEALEIPHIFGLCPKWVGNKPQSGLCDKENQYGACYAEKDVFRPLAGMDTQCLMKEQYEGYKCPEAAPHKCKFVEAALENSPIEAPQIYGLCPHWVGNRRQSGMCDKENQFGACYVGQDVFRPRSKMNTVCLMKAQYKTFSCPEATPHKCKFVEEVERELVDAPQSFGLCPIWVGRHAVSGMCDTVNDYGACYAKQETFRPNSKMDTVCLGKDRYKDFRCPASIPHKCEFAEAAVQSELAESPELFGLCPRWVGSQRDSGLCDKVNQFGACFAEKDRFRPLAGMDTQCLLKDQYKHYTCPKEAPHKCKFHLAAQDEVEKPHGMPSKTPSSSEMVI